MIEANPLIEKIHGKEEGHVIEGDSTNSGEAHVKDKDILLVKKNIVSTKVALTPLSWLWVKT